MEGGNKHEKRRGTLRNTRATMGGALRCGFEGKGGEVDGLNALLVLHEQESDDREVVVRKRYADVNM